MIKHNSLKFWVDYYTNKFKKEYEQFNKNYKNELNKWLLHHQDSYNKRDDKQSTDIIIIDSVKGQLNQINAIQKVLEGLK